MTEELLAKLVSGDLLPHFGPFSSWPIFELAHFRAGPFSSWNFAPWNHHAVYSIPKMDSKWDCKLSTQSFV